MIPKTDDALKPEVIKWAAFYEHRCKMGAKQIFHLEAFVAKYMRLYERYVYGWSSLQRKELTRIAIQWVSTLIPHEVWGYVIADIPYFSTQLKREGVLALLSACALRSLVITSWSRSFLYYTQSFKVAPTNTQQSQAIAASNFT